MTDGLQTSLDRLIREEEALTWSCHRRLGSVVILAERALALLNTFVVSIDQDHPFSAALMLAIHKASSLAFLSLVRKHLAQSQLNQRLMIEYTSLTAYMMAHPDTDMTQPNRAEPGKLMPSKKIAEAAYRWMNSDWPHQSGLLKGRKDQINDTLSHANIYGTHFTFDWEGSPDDVFKGSFFDQSKLTVEQTYLLAFVQLVCLVVYTLCEVAAKHGALVIRPQSLAELIQLGADCDTYGADLAKRLDLR